MVSSIGPSSDPTIGTSNAGDKSVAAPPSAPADSSADAPTSDTPAVTVSTGAAATPTLTTYAPTIYTDEVNQDIAVMNDSKASVDDQLNAYVDLNDLQFNGDLLAKAGNMQDVNAAADALENSAIAQRVTQVGSDYNSRATSDARSQIAGGQQPNGNDLTMAALNRLSPDDQEVLFVALQANANFDSVADWKAQMAQGVPGLQNTSLQQIAARFNLAGSHVAPEPTYAEIQAAAAKTAAATPASTAASSDPAKATAGPAAAAPDPKTVEANKALATLKAVSAQEKAWTDALKAQREGKPLISDQKAALKAAYSPEPATADASGAQVSVSA